MKSFVVLLALFVAACGDKTVQLEGRTGTVSCAAALPWSFTAGASFTYSR